MKLPGKKCLTGWLTAGLLCGALVPARAGEETPAVGAAPVLWDTSAPLGANVSPESRSGWKVVPRDLMLLEKDPAKSRSDPGYYGREYAFEGDAVVQTRSTTAVFSSAKGSLALFANPAAGAQDAASVAKPVKVAELAPLFSGPGVVTLSALEVVRNSGDQVVLQADFSQAGSPRVTCTFAFDRWGIIEVQPGENLKEIRLASAFAYGVVPGFIADDLIYGGPERPTNGAVAVPTENLFLGLLEGENTELAMTWPKAKQRMTLRFGEGQAQNLITSVEFDTAGQSFYLAPLSAPGIWHKENLTADFLEKDVAIQWKPPFPAKWKTQLYEEDLKTTFDFRPSKGEIWRGVAGSYAYPVWFNDGKALYHLGKKIQPKGESLIYCLEGQDTPTITLTPADILQQTLGRSAAGDILDFAGRKLRTHHRRAGIGVRRACTCGCTEAIQAVFEKGEEEKQQDYIKAAVEDMIYFVRRHVERIKEYQRFADALLKQIEGQKRAASPELKPFFESLEEIAKQIPQECDTQKENMKTLQHADELSKQTLALASRKDPNNLKAYMELLKAWRAMGGAQDYVVAKCHVIARNLSQAAGYGCAPWPGAVPFAEQVRAQCRQILRNPDGYEVWADY